MDDGDEFLTYQTQVTKSGQVGYVQVGNGPALILIVGYSGTLFHWNRYFIQQLAKSFTVYMIDNRKVGLSDSNNEHSLLGMAHDVIDFIEAKKLKSIYLFGWSMGGMISQTLLKSFKDYFMGAVLLATIPHGSFVDEGFVNLIANSEHIPAHEFRQQLYAKFFSEAPREELKEFITEAAVEIKGYHYRYNFEAKEFQDYAVAKWDGLNESDLAAIAVPVLLLRARNDQVVDDRAYRFMQGVLPVAKTITYPDGGHFFLHKSPVGVAKDVANFFNLE